MQAELPNHTVAVKRFFTLSNEGINKLKSEFYTLESLRHENLVRLFDVYVGKGLYLMVYEYMENRSLADALFGMPILLIAIISYNNSLLQQKYYDLTAYDLVGKSI